MHQGLSLTAATFSYQSKTVIPGINLDLPYGQITTLLGPNGSGKSTLMKGLGRQITPSAGEVRLDGAPLASFSVRELARRIGYLPQSLTQPEGFTVRELVAMGRYAYRRPFAPPSQADRQAVDEAMELCDLGPLQDRLLGALSGGQRQRAWIAMVLAQQTDILLLDEPTTYLDVAHQVELLELLRRLNRQLKRTIVLVLHDLNQALTYADQVVLMKDGKVVVAGPPAQVFSEATLSDTYELALRVHRSATDDTPFVMPLAVRENA